MKNFVKAMLIGILEIVKGLGVFLVGCLIYAGPTLFIVIITGKLMRNFDLAIEEGFSYAVALTPVILLLGTSISSKIKHAINAVEYAKEKQCDIHEAWEETELIGGDGCDD